MSAPGALWTVVVEAVVMQQGAATAEVAQRTKRRSQLGRKDRHIRPVKKGIFEKIVVHPFLNRREAAPVAMGVDQTGQQQLSAVANHSRSGVCRCDRGKRPGFGDRAAGDRDGPARNYAGVAQPRIGDRVGAAQDDCLSHSYVSAAVATLGHYAKPPTRRSTRAGCPDELMRTASPGRGAHGQHLHLAEQRTYSPLANCTIPEDLIMARLPPITSKDQVAAEHRATFDSIVQSRGAVQGPFTMFLHSPELAGRLAHLGAYVRFEGSLDMRVRVLAAMTVAREFEAVYVWGAQTGGARRLGVPEATITAIRENHSRGIPPEDAEIVEFTRQLLRKHRIDDASAKKLRARFGNDGFIQLTGAIGYYSMLAMTVNACELEAAPNAEVLKI
jgi:4-carboxymuconolactone decarboxylase